MFRINSSTCHGLKYSIMLVAKMGGGLPFLLIINAIHRCLCQNNNYKVGQLFNKKHKMIFDWFNQHVNYGKKEIDLNSDIFSSKGIELTPKKEGRVIWTFWFQGEESMPLQVHMCYAALKKYHSDTHEVILLTKENYQKYTNLPELSIGRFLESKTTIQEFSNLIRLNLLYNHGGVWIDSTMMLLRPIPASIFEMPFFSLAQENMEYQGYVSHYRWNTSFMASKAKNNSIGKIYELLLRYHLKYSFNVDYFIFDYVVDVVSRNDSLFAAYIESIKPSCPDVDHFVHEINNQYVESIFSGMLDNNFVIKLNHRDQYLERVDGLKTNFGHLVELLK